jgi:hypothetical protein
MGLPSQPPLDKAAEFPGRTRGERPGDVELRSRRFSRWSVSSSANMMGSRGAWPLPAGFLYHS